MSVEWMFHVDIPLEAVLLQGNVMSIARYRMRNEMMEGFALESVRARVKVELGHGYVVAQGWRVEEDEQMGGEGEMVVFVGGEEDVVFEGVKDGVVWSEVRHDRRLEPR